MISEGDEGSGHCPFSQSSLPKPYGSGRNRVLHLCLPTASWQALQEASRRQKAGSFTALLPSGQVFLADSVHRVRQQDQQGAHGWGEPGSSGSSAAARKPQGTPWQQVSREYCLGEPLADTNSSSMGLLLLLWLQTSTNKHLCLRGKTRRCKSWARREVVSNSVYRKLHCRSFHYKLPPGPGLKEHSRFTPRYILLVNTHADL